MPRSRPAVEYTRIPSLVLIAQVVFFLECGLTHRQTDRQTHEVTDATDHPILAIAGVGKEAFTSDRFHVMSCHLI